MKIYSYLENARFYGNRNLVFRIRGWCITDDGHIPSLKLRTDSGETVNAECVRQNRTDVIHKEKLNNIDSPDFGFCITIADDLEKILQAKKIMLEAEYNNTGKTILVLDGKRLRRKYDESHLIVHIDSQKEFKDELRISGWVLCYRSACAVRLTDKNGSDIPADIQWENRLDLERLGYADKNTRPCFTISVKPPYTDTKIFNITFSGAGKEKTIPVRISDGNQKHHQSDRNLIQKKLLQPSYWKRALHYLRQNGLRSTLHHTFHRADEMGMDYAVWFEKHRVKSETLMLQKREQREWQYRPLISICIPFYNTPVPFLEKLLSSILNQSYTNWELCIADGSSHEEVNQYLHENYENYLQTDKDHDLKKEGRFVYKRLTENNGISGNTNAAVEMASGEYIMLSDHDDFLEPDALYEMVKKINEDPLTDIVYTDEDLTDADGQEFFSPRFKPDFNPDFLCSINYICHIFMVRTSIMKDAGGFRKEYDGAQDWDMILRCTEKTDHIAHVPRILYHWRAHEESTAGNPDSKRYAIDAGKKAVEDHYKRTGQKARVDETNVFVLFQPYLFCEGQPKVSVVICSRDQADTLRTCVRSILDKTTYRNYEVIIVENNSTEQKTFDLYKKLCENSHVKVVTYRAEGPFNYSAVNNFGVARSDGDYVILLNNDTKIITPDWIERMLGYCQRDNTGIVGAKLYYPDQTVQHCGVVVGMGGFAGHVETMRMRGDAGYFGRLLAPQDISAVTGACMMIKRSVWDEVGGLDPAFRIALNDVDLCLRVRTSGRLVVLDPAVELYHYESKSRGSDDSGSHQDRFKEEIRLFRNRWKDVLDSGDPYYNPNLSLMYGDCRVRGDDEYFQIVEDINREDSEK